MSTQTQSDKLLKPSEAADLLATTPQVLGTWRWRGDGPPYVRVGRSIRYSRRMLDEWLEQRTVRPNEGVTA